MVVRAGAAKPKIGSVDEFRRTLLAVASIGYSDSASGTWTRFDWPGSSESDSPRLWNELCEWNFARVTGLRTGRHVHCRTPG